MYLSAHCLIRMIFIFLHLKYIDFPRFHRKAMYIFTHSNNANFPFYKQVLCGIAKSYEVAQLVVWKSLYCQSCARE